MEQPKTRIKLDLLYGVKNKGSLLRTFRAGHALPEEDGGFISIYRWDPGRYDYAVPNRAGNGRYTVFGRKLYVDGTCRFQNPVGIACVPKDMTDHLVIQFNAMPQDRRLYVPLVKQEEVDQNAVA